MASAGLALLLVVAGALKLADPRPATGSLRRVSATMSRQPAGRLELAVRAIGALELAAAAASMMPSDAATVSGSATIVLLCVGFVWFTNLARRRGAACGCWGSLSDGPTGTAEVARRAVLFGVALACLAIRVDRPDHAPIALAVGVVVLGCGVGGVLGAREHRLPRVVTAATIGVAVPSDAQRAVSRRVRRSTLATVRHDLRVGALVAAMPHARIEWRHARVTSAERRGQDMSNRLVAVPGAGGNLRVVAGPAGVLVAIGESPDAIYTVREGNVAVAAKVAAKDTIRP
jgi:hypothetical protein